MLIKVDGGTISSYSIRLLKADNPDVMFPDEPTKIPAETLAEYNVFRVGPTPLPVYDPMTQKVVAVDPVWADDQYVQAWDIIALTQEEMDQKVIEEAARVAAEEDQLLYEQGVDNLKTDRQMRQFFKATPAQIDNYIETNVTSLATAKSVLKMLAKAVSVLAHEVYK